MAVLIPTNSPLVFTNAPPEFPGLTAASVWINDSIPIARPLVIDEMLRALALTIPAVTVEVNPNGLPTAKTHSPTLSASELPMGITGNFSASILMRAKSVVASVPIITASNVRLSLSVISSRSAPSITWLLVTM